MQLRGKVLAGMREPPVDFLRHPFGGDIGFEGHDLEAGVQALAPRAHEARPDFSPRLAA